MCDHTAGAAFVAWHREQMARQVGQGSLAIECNMLPRKAM
jgi:hypothetical protein